VCVRIYNGHTTHRRVFAGETGLSVPAGHWSWLGRVVGWEPWPALESPSIRAITPEAGLLNGQDQPGLGQLLGPLLDKLVLQYPDQRRAVETRRWSPGGLKPRSLRPMAGSGVITSGPGRWDSLSRRRLVGVGTHFPRRRLGLVGGLELRP
jgi:hypothetical protein